MSTYKISNNKVSTRKNSTLENSTHENNTHENSTHEIKILKTPDKISRAGCEDRLMMISFISASF
jgi:hypothetical protein